MTTITDTKLNRRIFEDLGKDKKGNKIYGKCIGYKPSSVKQKKVIEHQGKKMNVFVSDGQVINPRREYKRQFGNNY